MEEQLLFVERIRLYRLNNILVNSFIIHSRHYSETSMIYDVLTEEHGLISILAKGIKSKKDGFIYQAICQLEVEILLTDKKIESYYITLRHSIMTFSFIMFH